jgi:hypothetical protein
VDEIETSDEHRLNLSFQEKWVRWLIAGTAGFIVTTLVEKAYDEFMIRRHESINKD